MEGAYASDLIYDDTDLEQLESLASTHIFFNVDLGILNADAQGTYQILHTTRLSLRGTDETVNRLHTDVHHFPIDGMGNYNWSLVDLGI